MKRQQAMPYCPKCGAEVLTDAKFCTNCGAALGVISAVPSPSSAYAEELAAYTEKASRLELFVRWLYGIAVEIVFAVWGFWNGICVVIHFWYILITGRRSPYFYRQTRRYVAAVACVSSYLTYLTDARPHLTPDKMLYVKEARTEAPE
jgi:hypothetical protein